MGAQERKKHLNQDDLDPSNTGRDAPSQCWMRLIHPSFMCSGSRLGKAYGQIKLIKLRKRFGNDWTQN